MASAPPPLGFPRALTAAAGLLAARSPPSLPREEAVDALSLTTHIDRCDDFVYLVDAESGYGKTVLGLTLSLLPLRFVKDRLIPIYIDLAAVDSERPLGDLEELLQRLKPRDESGLRGRPLFVFDALNETVDPGHFVAKLSGKREDLQAMRAKLLFLYSFRHRSYPSRLRAALVDRDFLLAGRAARRAAQRLFTGVEPVGLKHRQCAVVANLRNGEDEAARVMREALVDVAAVSRTASEHRALAEGYYEAMGASPDDYLAEFFGRLDAIAPAARSSS